MTVSDRSRKRVPLRLHPDTHERVAYWADKHQVSINGYIEESVEEAIRRENGDYDLPTLEIARLNQLVDEIQGLRQDQANLSRQVSNMTDMIVKMVAGESGYLEDEMVPSSIGESSSEGDR